MRQGWNDGRSDPQIRRTWASFRLAQGVISGHAKQGIIRYCNHDPTLNSPPGTHRLGWSMTPALPSVLLHIPRSDSESFEATTDCLCMLESQPVGQAHRLLHYGLHELVASTLIVIVVAQKVHHCGHCAVLRL